MPHPYNDGICFEGVEFSECCCSDRPLSLTLAIAPSLSKSDRPLSLTQAIALIVPVPLDSDCPLWVTQLIALIIQISPGSDRPSII